MSDEAKNTHVRADKIPTYLAAVGSLTAGLWGLAIAVSFPVLTFVAAVGTLAGASLSENVRGKLKKIGDQAKDFARDLKSHVKEDFHRVTNWWGKRREKKTAEKAASIEQATAAFRGGSSQLQFTAAAHKPETVVQVAPPVIGAQPAAAPEAPKP